MPLLQNVFCFPQNSLSWPPSLGGGTELTLGQQKSEIPQAPQSTLATL